MSSGVAEAMIAQPIGGQVAENVPGGNARRGAHLPQLDALRGIAILAVLMFHCLGFSYGMFHLHYQHLDLPSVLRYPISCGWAGVALFFVLSGFVIHYATLGSRTFSVSSFYRRRFFRIYPPYLVALIFFCTLGLFGGGIDHVTLFRNFLAHLFVIHNLFGSTYFGINASFWSLAVEIQFYLLYPLLLLVWRRIGPAKTLLAVLGVSIVYRSIGYCMTNWADDVSFAFWLNTPSLWVDWVLGAYLAEQFYHGRKVFRRRLLWASVFLVLFVATDLFKPTSVLSFTVASVLSAIAIEACLYTGELARRRWALLSTLGLCSYSVYLWHQPLMDLLYRHGHIERLPHGCLRFSVMLSLTLLILFPFGYLMYVTVENGSRMLGKIGRTSHFKPLAFTSTNESDPTLR